MLNLIITNPLRSGPALNVRSFLFAHVGFVDLVLRFLSTNFISIRDV